MANLCVRYGSFVFVMVNLKNVVFFMVKYRCVRYGCVRYDGTPIENGSLPPLSSEIVTENHPSQVRVVTSNLGPRQTSRKS